MSTISILSVVFLLSFSNIPELKEDLNHFLLEDGTFSPSFNIFWPSILHLKVLEIPLSFTTYPE